MPAVISITVFLGLFFPLIELYTVFIILFFLIRLVGTPIKLFWSAISGLGVK